MLALLTACRSPSAALPTATAFTSATAVALPTITPTPIAVALPTPTVEPTVPPVTPRFVPSTIATTYVSPSGWFTLTLPAPWIELDAATRAATAELTAIRPDEHGELTALLTVTTTPAAGLTLSQLISATVQELATQADTTVTRSQVDLTYRLRDQPLGITDYTVADTGDAQTAAGRQYALYLGPPRQYLVLTFTGTRAVMRALDQQIELIIARLQTVE